LSAVLVIDLRDLERAPVEVEGEIAPDDPVWEVAGCELIGPLAVRATADGSATRGVWVRGSFVGRVRAHCRRCLDPLELEVVEEFAVFFDPQASDSDEDLMLYALEVGAEELDLRAPLGERFVLNVPAYPVCSEGCAGLCPVCGKSLNDGACGCVTTETDPRWGPLQGLKSEN
jgi:uncharacterized protein